MKNERARCLMWAGLLLLAMVLGFAGCKPARQVYDVKGTVVEVFPEGDQVRIAHERIPGYMEAMTMIFDVKQTNELAGIRERDVVSFRMVVTEEDGWIEQVKKIGEAPMPADGAAAGGMETTRMVKDVKDVEELGVGDVLPNYQFTNQFNQVIATDDFRGRAWAVTFIFTRCPFPVYCPRMSTHFKAVAEQLKGKANAPTNWHLLTVSFDPRHDTPEVLRAYAQRYDYDPAHWTFATGGLAEISAMGDHFGLLFWTPDPSDPGNLSHNLRTIVVDPEGRVRAIYPDENWKVEELVEELVKAAKG